MIRSSIIDEIIKIRDCVSGSMLIKAKRGLYLPHPSMIDTTSKEQIARYDAYLAGAEFDDIPAQTLRTLIGQVGAADAEIEMPAELAYLAEDADGDGMSLSGLMELSAANALQVKWHVLVAEYISPAAGSTLAEAERSRPRAVIRHYAREAVSEWEYRRVDGRMQLCKLKLHEQNDDGDLRVVTIGLNEAGEYYQQVDDEEPSVVYVGGSPLKWMPVEFISDEEFPAGKLPEGMGYLSGVCDLTLARYRAFADYKEAMRCLPPTTHVKGVSAHDWEMFKEINGRSYVATGAGAVNVWPSAETSVDVIGTGQTLEAYERYFEANEKRIRAVGGVFPSDREIQKTATEAEIASANQLARLLPVLASLESGIRRIMVYCGMFEGLWGQEKIEENLKNVTITLPRSFANRRLTPQEVKEHRENMLAGAISRDEFVRILSAGGWTVSDSSEMETDGPDLLPVESGV